MATLRSSFTDHFQQDKFTTFNLLTRFQSLTQLQLQIYYHVKKLTMEEKIIAAIQHILSKSKQRVTSQRIFRFINKGALSIDCEIFHDCINGLEIDGRIYKKKGFKNTSFFINPISQDNNENDEPNNIEKVHKSPESPKAIEKLESFTDQVPGIIQNITSNLPPINTPLLYRKDNLDGHSSSVCTDGRIFHEEVLFLRRELVNKQKTIDSLLNIINYMHTNSNKSDENIYKNTNAHPTQINGTAEEQGNENLTVEDNTYKDISRNQTQCEEHRNKELQQNPDIGNRSIITIENQLTEFRKKHQEKFTQIKKPHILPNYNEKL